MKRWLQLQGRLDISNSISRLGRPRKPPFVFLGRHLVCAMRENDNRHVCIKLSVHKVVKSLCLWILVSWKRFYPSLYPCAIPKNLSLTWKNKITAITVESNFTVDLVIQDVNAKESPILVKPRSILLPSSWILSLILQTNGIFCYLERETALIAVNSLSSSSLNFRRVRLPFHPLEWMLQLAPWVSIFCLDLSSVYRSQVYVKQCERCWAIHSV